MLADAKDQSTYFVTAEFLDESGDPVTPITLVWSLLDGLGAVVNGRLDVPITPAASVTIALSGDDLIFSDDPLPDERHALFEGTYTSSQGVKPIRDCAIFNVVAVCS